MVKTNRQLFYLLSVRLLYHSFFRMQFTLTLGSQVVFMTTRIYAGIFFITLFENSNIRFVPQQTQ